MKSIGFYSTEETMNHLDNLNKKYPDLEECLQDIQSAYDVMQKAFQQGKKLLVCGNGGSASDSEHIVGELMKGFRLTRPIPVDLLQKLVTSYPDHGAYMAAHLQGALPTISLVSQTALLTAFSNDVAPDLVFAQQVYGYGRPGDVLLALSTSGVSRNVIYAIEVARTLELQTIGLTGKSGGVMKGLCTVTIQAPWEQTSDIQERHLAIYHTLCAMLEDRFFGQSGIREGDRI
jgi:phosphoheptose isomerase